MKDKVIIFGNGIDNWIINELFYDLRNSDNEDIIWADPYEFTTELKKKYTSSFREEERKHMNGFPASRWRQYSTILDIIPEIDEVLHFFFIYGRDIQRLYDPVLLEWIKDTYSERIKTYLVLFDSIKVTTEFHGWGKVTSIFNNFDYVCSFDPDDCKQYDLIPFIDPYPKHIIKNQSIIKTDLFFIGIEKGRGELLKEIALASKKHNVKAKFIVSNWKSDEIPGIVRSPYIPYKEMLSEAASSSCLLELIADGQSGCSLRYYEAVVYNKKLISNCKHIVDMPYYNPRFMKIIDTVEDIDFEWIINGEEVDYHYKDSFSIRNFVGMILNGASKKNLSARHIRIKDPLISVIIPTYNRASTIKKSINSVLQQTYTNLEVIIVDDGSTDKTEEIINEIKDPRVRLIIQKNQGACSARNTGIDAASGDYIAFQDSDDEWMPNKLDAQMQIFSKEVGADVVFCNALKNTLDEDGIEKLVLDERESGFIDRDMLQKKSMVSTQTMLMRAICLKDIRFDPEMPRLQDFDLVYRLSESYAFYFVNDPLVKIYVQKDSISMDPRKSIAARRRMIEKYPYVMKRNNAAYLQMLFVIMTNSKLVGEPDKEVEREYNRVKKLKNGSFKKKIKSRYFGCIHFLETHLPENQMETLRKWYQPIKRVIFRLPKQDSTFA